MHKKIIIIFLLSYASLFSMENNINQTLYKTADAGFKKAGDIFSGTAIISLLTFSLDYVALNNKSTASQRWLKTIPLRTFAISVVAAYGCAYTVEKQRQIAGYPWLSTSAWSWVRKLFS